MDRKEFIKKSILTGALTAIAPQLMGGSEKQSTYDKLMHNIGFNHLPNK